MQSMSVLACLYKLIFVLNRCVEVQRLIDFAPFSWHALWNDIRTTSGPYWRIYIVKINVGKSTAALPSQASGRLLGVQISKLLTVSSIQQSFLSFFNARDLSKNISVSISTFYVLCRNSGVLESTCTSKIWWLVHLSQILERYIRLIC